MPNAAVATPRRNFSRALSENEQDVLHSKLGDVYVIAGEALPGSLASYHAALSLNPASDAALTGLDRLESSWPASTRT